MATLLKAGSRLPKAPMSPLVETLLFVFGLVALGYLSGATGYLRIETGDALSKFAIAVALSLLLFRTVIGDDFNGSVPRALWAAYFIAVAAAWTTEHLVMMHILGLDGQSSVLGGVPSAFLLCSASSVRRGSNSCP